MAPKTKDDSIEPWVQRYINKLKNMMGLSNWTIVVSPNPSSPDTHGETEVVYGQHFAKMYLNKDFRKQPPEMLRDIAVHELLHCHMEPMIEVISEVIKASTNQEEPSNVALHKTVVALLEYETERIVDSISESMGKWLPTPDMPKPRKRKSAPAKKVVKKKSSR